MAPDVTRTWTAPDGASVFYRLARLGSGRPVLVLLHGMASNSTRWNEFARETSLLECCDLLRIDRRGQGRSIWRGATGMGECCDDIAGILRAEGYDNAFVGGHCLGANIAIAFAGRYPALTSGLVLVEPMLREALTGSMAAVARWRWALRAALATVRGCYALGLHRRAVAELDLEELDRRTRRGDSDLSIYASPFLDLRTTPTASYLGDLLAVTEPLAAPASIDVPVLALLSRQSTMTDPSRTKQAISAFRDLTCVEIDARHWIPTEQPRAMREAIEQWVAYAATRTSRNLPSCLPAYMAASAALSNDAASIASRGASA